MTVRFAHICDHCGKRGEEYSAMPTCSECQKHTCADCDVPAQRTEDERNLTTCKACQRELDHDERYRVDGAVCLRLGTDPAEVSPEQKTPFEESAGMRYREDMKDAGRGHLLR